jgi:hypothetical protein
VKEKKVQKRYDEEFKRQAVELVIHSGKPRPGAIGRLYGGSPSMRPAPGVGTVMSPEPPPIWRTRNLKVK